MSDKILCFGELLLRLSAPGHSRFMQTDTMKTSFAGSEANVAVSLSNFGEKAIYISKFPANEIGYAAANTLRYFGVDVDHIKYDNGRMGLFYMENGASQRPSKVIYDRAFSSIALAKKDEFDWDELFDGVTWFHWSGITPALSDELADICFTASKIARSKGITVSCDLNYRKKLWSEERAQEVMKKIMPFVDVCIANEEDADKVLGIKADNSDVENGNLDKKGYEKVARKICEQYGCNKVAFTLRKSINASVNGWSGMLFDAKQQEAFFSKYYEIQLVDRVGGGDSFSAAIIYALRNLNNCSAAIEFATAASCLNQTIEGDFNRVSVDEVMSLVNSSGNGRVDR